MCKEPILMAFALLLAPQGNVRPAAPAPSRMPPSQAESLRAIRAARSWADAAFSQPTAAEPPREAIVVVRARNHVLQNRTGWKTPLTLGEKQYDRGIYMDTPATVRVLLSGPAVELSAEVGIDNNADTQKAPETGSARFHVAVDGKRVASTPVLKMTDGPTALEVPLGGAREFVLEVDDGGDGISHDQCDWADAVVKLADGTTRSLGELPLVGPAAARELGVPFSFRYDDQPSDRLLQTWQYAVHTESDADGEKRIVSYKDPKTGLLVECHLRGYPDAPVVDWTCYLANTGTADTPIISEFASLDVADLLGSDGGDGAVTLRWSNGDRHDAGKPTPASFMPHDELLVRGEPRRFASLMSHQVLPFFNLMPAADARGRDVSGGWIVAVGWTGNWTAEFLHHRTGELSVRAGLREHRFYLKPGERVRMPRVALFRWCGDEMIHGHNQFRRLMLAHYVPKLNGKLAEPPCAASDVAGLWMRARRAGRQTPEERFNEQGELALISKLADAGCEVYWMDAYWFPQPWWSNYGNWFARPDDFPRGLRPLADAAHEKGLRFVLWFATQTAHEGTILANEHPELFYKGQRGGLLKLGDPEACRLITDWMCQRVREWGVDVYREDIVSELPADEAPDRVGVDEMRHVDGFYRFWSELRRRNPGLLIDNCCGGGNKIDLETASLAFVLWRSDLNDIGEGLKGKDYWPRLAMADQVHVAGLSLYFPFHTGPAWEISPYSIRSAMTSGIVLYNDLVDDRFPWDEARRGIAEVKSLRPLFQGDLYPLLEITTSQRDWHAFQLDRPDLGEGCVLFFRRPESATLMSEVALYNIDPEAEYRVSITGETFDQGPWRTMTGRELIKPEVIIHEKPGSALLRYTRLAK